jgi:hypothetical protein
VMYLTVGQEGDIGRVLDRSGRYGRQADDRSIADDSEAFQGDVLGALDGRR